MSTSAPDRSAGVLYVVATPIGNLEDLSPRAARVLGEVAVIACEDTRHSAHLLAAHSIRTPLLSCFEHNEVRRVPELLARLGRGESVALISDAGTPAISDPGYRLVRATLEAGFRVVAIPGPSAVIAAVSVAGLPTDRFTFEGFLPQKSGARRRALEALGREPRTMVFFEAARRLADTIEDMEAVFGADREAVIVREISKTFEESMRGTLSELRERTVETAPRGEIVMVVAGAPATAAADAHAAAGATVTVEALCAAGISLKDASAAVAKMTGASRREVYQQALARRSRTPE